MKRTLKLLVLITVMSTPVAFAINLTTSTAPVQYAAETLNPGSFTKTTNDKFFANISDTAIGTLDLIGTLGIRKNTIFTSTDFYVRFELQNAVFSANLSPSNLTITTIGTAITIRQGGLIGDSFVLFNVDPSATNVGTETFALALAGIAISKTGPTTAAFSTFTSLGDAVNQTNQRSGSSKPYVKLVDGIKVTSTQTSQLTSSAAAFKTYVNNQKTTNATGTVASLGILSVTSTHVAVSNVVYDQSGSVHTINDSVSTDTSIEISGDFNNGTYYLDSNARCPLSASPPSTAATGALTLTNGKLLATQTLGVLNTKSVLCHVVDGTTEVTSSTYNAMIKYVATSGSSVHADELINYGSVTRDNLDLCLEGTPAPASDSSLPVEANLYMANPGTNFDQQTFIRLVNPGATSTAVEIYATDDSGRASGKGPIKLALAANASLQFTIQDLEFGNTPKGLTNTLCDGQGKWRLLIRSASDVEVMGFIRTKDGFLTGLSSRVPESNNNHLAYFVNPAKNTNQESFLRVVNLGSSETVISITAFDDEGMPASGSGSLVLQPNEAKQLTASDLENGNAEKSLTGGLGTGTGKWQLSLFSQLELAVISMIRTKDGFLTNLSGVAPKSSSDITKLYFVNPASETAKKSFIRLVNLETKAGTITIAGIDDNGSNAPGGDVTLTLGANQSIQVTAKDLENGNAGKGLVGRLGDGAGLWHLDITATVDLTALNLIRTADGFLTNVSQASPIVAQVNKLFFFNPASNQKQRSSLRLVNTSSQSGSVTISGTDDLGNSAPGGNVTFNIVANGGKVITAQDLENGNAALGLSGSLGNGSGKWRLRVTADVNVEVQSLLDTPNGFITNLSDTTSD